MFLYPSQHQQPVRGRQISRTHPLARGLIGYWPFNDGTGLKSWDYSGNDNQGTLKGTAPVWAAGRRGWAINFPGTNERVNCGNGAPLDDLGNGDFSISFRMKSKDAVPLNYGALFTKTQNSDNRFELYSVGTDSQFAFILVKGGVYQDYVFSFNLDIFDGTLRHIVVAINRTTDKILCYVDTVKDATELNIDTLPADISNTGNVILGSRSGGFNPYEGILDECRIYDRVLTQEEISWLYREPGILFESYLPGRFLYVSKRGLLSATFIHKKPNMTFVHKKPNMTFVHKKPNMTFS